MGCWVQVDVVCEDPAGVKIVIEVKTRIVTLERHNTAYREVNPAKPRAGSGRVRLPNSLYWRHQLQLAQTVKMFRRRQPKGTVVVGYVLCAVQGSALPYPLQNIPNA